MKKDFPNVIIDNVLTNEEIASIFEIVNKTSDQSFLDNLSYNSWHIKLPEEIENKFLQHAENIAGVKLRLLEYNLSRYENVTSNCGKYKFYPLLFPHTDEAFSGPRVTLDYQIQSNIDWEISIDDWTEVKNFLLKDNQLLSFSGTHQIHWRPKKDFIDGQFLTAIFLHFEPINYEPLTSVHIDEMRRWARIRWEEWKQTEGRSSNSQDESNDIYRYIGNYPNWIKE